MKKVVIWAFMSCCYLKNAQAQNIKKMGWIWGPSIGWQYQHGNFLKTSGWALFAPNDDQYIKMNAGANFTWMQGKTTIIPEIGFTYYVSNRLLFPFVQAEATPYTLTPKIGVSIFSLVDVGLGYGFNIKTKESFKPLKGITGSVTLNIPLNFY